MRYFVTGATGFIGGRLARRLAADGHEVTALVRNPAAASGLAATGTRLHPGDITDRASMADGMRGADGVFHVAGWYKIGVRDPSPGIRINVDGTRNVLEMARDLGIPKTVYTSTLAVFSDTGGRVVDETYRHDGPWLSEYDRTKWLAHYEVAEPMVQAGLPLVVVQPGIVYGPGDTSTMRATLIRYLARRLPVIPKDTGYCWGHVDDTVGGHVRAMEMGRTGESYIIAGPPHTLIDALAIAEEVTGISAPRWHVSPSVMRALSGFLQMAGRADFAEVLRVAAGVTYWGSSAKAEREFGFHTRSLREGFRDTLAHEMRMLGIAQQESPAGRRTGR
ncbi:MAG TPA: NAD-dependent epimerase/dehydratase family protein [bacterium]|nr:NAD-dependent epimerase/dehydratase family protein [bacterium]